MKTTTLALAALVALAACAVAADLPAQGASAGDELQRAQIFAARESWSDAVAAYKGVIAANPKDPVLHNRLGICYQRMGDAKAARNAYRMAVELDPNFAEAHNNLGTIEHTRGKYKRAIAAYNEAIRIKPQDPLFHKNLGAAWLARGSADKALAAWSEAFRLDPLAFEHQAVRVASTDVSAARQFYLFAKLVAARGEVDKALDYLAKAQAAGFSDFGKVETDHDFAAIVTDPRYAALK